MKHRLKGLLALVLSLTMLLGMVTVSYGAANDHADKIKVKETDLTETGYYNVSNLSQKLVSAPAPENAPSGYVHWDSSTGTLELYNATISHDGLEGIWGNENYTIVLAEGTSTVTSSTHNAIYSQGSVTIRGSGTLNATGDDNGIECEYTTNISDSATVTIVGKNSGIITKHYGDGVVIDSTGTVTITGSSAYGIGNYGSSNAPQINSANVMVKGETAAFQMAPVLGSGITAQASTDINGSNPEAYDSTKLNTYKWFKSEVPTPTTYPVKIGGVAFASDNLEIDSNDITGVTGTATYIPAEGTNPAILKLNGFEYECSGHGIESNENLTLQLLGDNKVGSNSGGAGIFVDGVTLTIDGTGSLTASGTSSGISADNVTIESGKVTATGGNDGISAEDVTISGGTVKATGGKYGIFAEGNNSGGMKVTISGGSVEAYATDDSDGIGIYAPGYGGEIAISGDNTQVTVGCATGLQADIVNIAGGSTVSIEAENANNENAINTTTLNMTGDYQWSKDNTNFTDSNTSKLTKEIAIGTAKLYIKPLSGSTPGNTNPYPPYIYNPTPTPEPEGTKVTSSKTFDGGIASAVVVTVLSATGSAWLAKKKD